MSPTPEVAEAWIGIAKQTIVVVTPIFSGLWFLIKRWGAMQEKVRRTQAEIVLKSVSDLKDQLEESKRVISETNIKLIRTREELIAIKVKLDENVKAEDNFIKQVDAMRSYTDARLKEVEGTLDNGEIIRLGDNRFMFKGRK